MFSRLLPEDKPQAAAYSDRGYSMPEAAAQDGDAAAGGGRKLRRFRS